MTSMTMHRPWTSPTLRRPMLVRKVAVWVDVINVAAAVLRPLLVSAGVVIAAVASPPPAHADPLGGSMTNTLNNVGIGNNGPISTALAGIGQSICPMLVQPGATFASAAAQMSGNGGLTPQIAGWVTSMAIQAQCPGVMTSLANGNLPFPLQMPGADGAPPGPFQLPGQPGANPAAPLPFQLPGVNPPPPSPFQVPGL
jgi:Protein of unknown function (DUF732)